MKYIIIPTFIITCVLAGCGGNEPDKKTTAAPAKPVSYTTAPVEKGGLATTMRLPAQLAAYQEVSIFPKVNGYVKTVQVDIGDKVNKGKLLMVLEAPELLQAAAQAKERYARNRANFSIDKEQYQRYLEASETEGAISPLDLSTIRSKMEADSALANAEKLNWEMQQTMLGYLQVTAPFAGVITERNVHPGALVSAAAHDKPMLELKQIDHLRLQVDVPEGIAAGIRDKDTVSFYMDAMPGTKLTGIINRQSMNMNAQFRSERMEIDVFNKNNQLSPGMYASVMLYAKGSVGALHVPRSAVVVSTERKYVLTMVNHKITKIDVRTGVEAGNNVEVYGALHEGDSVIVNANDEIKETP